MTKVNKFSNADLKAKPVGKHCDGSGLWLFKRSATRGSWVLKVSINGKRRELGLGGYPAISLSQARKNANKMRQQIRHVKFQRKLAAL